MREELAEASVVALGWGMNHALTLSLVSLMSLIQASANEEDLNAPPEVSAKAWAVADAASGEVIWASNAGEPRKSASTTKMMCAYVVLKLAEKEPAVLDEVVTFSKVASSTPGSTSEVKLGESLTVKDCLYGLMLPSGNDAGNALGEHFNKRLAPPDEKMKRFGLANPVLASRVNFIAEMNRHARLLGMKDTIYRATFGDGGTENDRTTTAADLCKLAAAAMKMERFRQIVNTREFKGTITKADGSVRTQRWENSNPLLKLGLGYDGIKTGMTNQAGHCLVVSARRGEQWLILVVMGCTNEETRSADVRNLARWAWRMRQPGLERVDKQP